MRQIKRLISATLLAACLLPILTFAQASPPIPGPLTSKYTFAGVSFRYPSNWTVRAKINAITVAPLTAFVEKTNGKDFVTHGLFLWVLTDTSLSLDDVTTRSLQSVQRNSPRLQINPLNLTRSGAPAWSSCGSTLDPAPPYTGTETGEVCTYKVGSLYVLMMTFSPSTEWDQYQRVFNDIVNTLSTDVTVPNVVAQPTPPAVPTPTFRQSPDACESGHWIQSVEGDGKIIKLENGSLWEVDDVDTVDTALWLPISNVVVCESKMINTDDSESADVTLLAHNGLQTNALNSSKRGYVIQATSNDETFVINDKVFKAKTYCFNFDKDDKVIFVEGSATGVCSSAQLLNLKNGKVCRVWCE